MGEKEKENGGGVTVVLKTDFHCDGCVSKVFKFIRSYHGVDTVTIEGQKITVVGNVDPAKLREKVEQKANTKVEQISPQPNNDGKNKEKDGGDNGRKEKKKENNKKSNDKSDRKEKEKEPPLTTAALKLNLHCDGCIHKIYKTVTKTKGYQEMKIDTQKDLVTVTGAMDMKALAETLQKQLKREVAIAPAKNEGEKKEKDGGNEKSGGDGGGSGGNAFPFIFGPVQAVGDPYALQMFSDENPNACSVM